MVQIWLQLCMEANETVIGEDSGIKNENQVQSLATSSFKPKSMSSTSSIIEILPDLPRKFSVDVSQFFIQHGQYLFVGFQNF